MNFKRKVKKELVDSQPLDLSQSEHMKSNGQPKFGHLDNSIVDFKLDTLSSIKGDNNLNSATFDPIDLTISRKRFYSCQDESYQGEMSIKDFDEYAEDEDGQVDEEDEDDEEEEERENEVFDTRNNEEGRTVRRRLQENQEEEQEEQEEEQEDEQEEKEDDDNVLEKEEKRENKNLALVNSVTDSRLKDCSSSSIFELWNLYGLNGSPPGKHLIPRFS